MRTLLALISLVAMPHLAAAQSWKADPNAKRLAWGNANVVLRADSTAGVQIWAVTSRVLDQTTPRRAYAARFDPDSIVEWLAYAQQLLAASKPPREAGTSLRTPTLVAIDGSRIYLDRAQERGTWASRVSIVFAMSNSLSPWSISTDKAATKDFLRTLLQTAAASFYRPSDPPGIPESNPVDPAACPFALTQPALRYPSVRQKQGQSGDVWLTFIVRADSTVDPESFKVLFSDGVEFTASAVRAVTSVRYCPLTRGGVPVAALAHQRVTFLVGQ